MVNLLVEILYPTAIFMNITFRYWLGGQKKDGEEREKKNKRKKWGKGVKKKEETMSEKENEKVRVKGKKCQK